MSLSNIEGILELCKNYKRIFIYGAGKNARSIYPFLNESKIPVMGFLVSNMNGNPDYIYNLPVMEIDCFRECHNDLIVVSIVKGSLSYVSVVSYLTKYQLQNVLFLSPQDMIEIKQLTINLKLKEIFEKPPYRLGNNIPVETYHSILIMRSPDGAEYHWRFRTNMIEQQSIGNILSLFPQKTLLDEYEKLYGRYRILHRLKKNPFFDQKSISVYMAQSHVDKGMARCPLPQWIIPIQVGAALTEQKNCEIRDNIGENISEKNTIYSECTALYWMWKNAPRTDYIGLCHYRRHFDMSEYDFIRLAGSDIDVLVTTPTFVNETIHSFFSGFVPQADECYLLKAIEIMYPEYLPEAKAFLNAKFFPPCNLSIMKYELFQKYAEYVFSITFEIESYYNELHFYRSDRYMGYLVEWLLGIFLMHHKDELKIAYTDMLFYS